MAIHLIRHGEVHNPEDVVYADIADFSLSSTGRAQAAAAGNHLARTSLSRIVSSPLDRAIETATEIATVSGAEVHTDERLTEWGLAVRWRGARWVRLPVVFPGELEAYLADPHHLPFCPEPLSTLAARLAAAIEDWSARSSDDVAFVSHQDPLHAAHLKLAGVDSAHFHDDKPGHGSVITLERADTGWSTVSIWTPPQE